MFKQVEENCASDSVSKNIEQQSALHEILRQLNEPFAGSESCVVRGSLTGVDSREFQWNNDALLENSDEDNASNVSSLESLPSSPHANGVCSNFAESPCETNCNELPLTNGHNQDQAGVCLRASSDAVEECDNESLASSTSCSTDSFEITTQQQLESSELNRRRNSLRVLEAAEKLLDFAKDSCSQQANDKAAGAETVADVLSQEALQQQNANKNLRSNPFLSSFRDAATSASVASAVDDDLDVCLLPQLDFEKLEQHLARAKLEREHTAQWMPNNNHSSNSNSFGVDLRTYPPSMTTRSPRSNLAAKLKMGKNLQLCFVNDLLNGSDDEDDSNGVGAETMSKSRSDPNIEEEFVPSVGPMSGASGLDTSELAQPRAARSLSSCSSNDSTKSASELQKLYLSQPTEDAASRQSRLECEAKLLLLKAKHTAQLQLEVERQTSSESVKSNAEDMIGIKISRKRLTRLQLTKMCITQLQIIVNQIHGRIEALNEELMRLLVERDNSSMEQDSILVDIEDLLQYVIMRSLASDYFCESKARTTPSFGFFLRKCASLLFK